MNPPQVVYPFVDVPGRPVGFSPIERTIALASMVFSRLHYKNVTVFATRPWLDYFQSTPALHRLVTTYAEIGEEVVAPYPCDIFWSTVAKMLACQTHSDLNPDSPLLLMDADVVIFEPFPVIAWGSPEVRFAAGYREPASWEAYVEGNERLWTCLQDAFYAATGNRYSQKIVLPRPINAGCLYFNSLRLLQSYAVGLKAFMGSFVKNGKPRPYLVDPADPSKGHTCFSEVMVADQQFLGMLVNLCCNDDREGTPVRYFVNEFPAVCEYPEASTQFIHFWKLKGWLNQNPAAAAVVEQSLLRSVYQARLSNPTFMEKLADVVVRQVPMTDLSYFQLL